MTLLRLFGVRVVINPLFFVLMAVMAFFGLGLETAVLFGVVLLHEIAHLVVASAYGMRAREIELMPFGGVARLHDILELDPEAEKAVAIAGPATNLFLAVLTAVIAYSGWLAAPFAGEAGWLLVGEGHVRFWLGVNLSMAAINLLPALPLDGGRVYRARLSRRIGFRRATQRAIGLSRILAMILVAVGAGAAYFISLNFLAVGVVGVFVFMAGMAERLNASYVFFRYLTEKKKDLNERGVLAAEHLVARPEVTIEEVLRHFVPKRYHLVMILDEAWNVSGVVNEVQVVDALLEEGGGLTLGDLNHRKV